MVELLADRDLGKRVPLALREVGVVIHTLADVFGSEEKAQQAKDVEWIELAGRNGWAALTKNRRIRYVSAERDALAEYGVPLFALSNGNLGFAAMAGAFLAAIPAIEAICALRPGGSVWIVHRDGHIEPQWPDPTWTVPFGTRLPI